MKRHLRSLLFLLGIAGTLHAQQDPQYTMFYFNKMLYNPAYAGAKDAICATVLGRAQWNGLPGSPNTWLVTADMPILLPTSSGKDQLGIGITTYGDYIGFQEDHTLKVALTYRRKDLGPGHLAIGIDLGFNNKNIVNPTWIFPQTFQTLPTGSNNSSFGFDMSAGIYYHNTNFYAGVSILHLTASNFNTLNVQQARHMYITGGYTFPLGGSNSSWKLNPNALIRTDFVTANFDVNLNAIYDINGTHGIFFGSTYRYQDAIGLNAGYNATFGRTGVLIGYNYDINTSRLSSFNAGSHEIILRICLNVGGCIIPPGGGCKLWVNRFGDTMHRRY